MKVLSVLIDHGDVGNRDFRFVRRGKCRCQEEEQRGDDGFHDWRLSGDDRPIRFVKGGVHKTPLRSVCVMSERSLRRKSCLNALREHDQVENPSPAPLDVEPFIGTWLKTNGKPGQWIERVEIAREGSDQIAVRLWGGDAPSPPDWGTAV